MMWFIRWFKPIFWTVAAFALWAQFYALPASMRHVSSIDEKAAAVGVLAVLALLVAPLVVLMFDD